MSKFRYQHQGSCRCGGVSLAFHCNTALQDFVARACQCEFCRPSGALYLSAVEGELCVSTTKSYYLYSHRFGSNTADFVHCAGCNTPVFVRSTLDGRDYAVVNAQALENYPAAAQTQDVDYDGEELVDRLARRARTWIPQLTIEYSGTK